MSTAEKAAPVFTAKPDDDGYFWIWSGGVRQSLTGFKPRNDHDRQVLETTLDLLSKRPPSKPHLVVPAWSLLIGLWFHRAS